MSLVCINCRRLVRDDNIYISQAEYFCSKCNKQYKLTQKFIDNYFHRYNSPVNSKIIVNKTEDTYSIKIPNGSKKAHVIFFLLNYVILSYFTYLFIKFGILYWSILFVFLNLYLLLFALFGSTIILLNKKHITIKQNLFGLVKVKRKLTKDLTTIYYIKYSNFLNGIKLDFGKIFNGVGLGMDLTDDEKKWLLKELKYMKHDLQR